MGRISQAASNAGSWTKKKLTQGFVVLAVGAAAVTAIENGVGDISTHVKDFGAGADDPILQRSLRNLGSNDNSAAAPVAAARTSAAASSEAKGILTHVSAGAFSDRSRAVARLQEISREYSKDFEINRITVNGQRLHRVEGQGDCIMLLAEVGGDCRPL